MTTHLTRDFLSVGEYNAPYGGIYLVAAFLRTTLGFTVVGQTGFNLDSGSITISSGLNAQINLGGVNTHAVLLPSATYVVQAADVGRILGMKSNSNPLFNSGLFRVTGIDSTNNYLYIQPRGIESPPAESSLSWRLFENEVTVATTMGNNPNSLTGDRYRTWGAAAASRIILQSPHSTAWQVRLTAENEQDCDNNAAGGRAECGAPGSIAPGFGGTSIGDFVPGGKHLHVPLWWNLSNISATTTATSQRAQNCLVGFTRRNSETDATMTITNGLRFYMWGDDVTGTCVIIARQHGESLATQTLIVFGVPEDEEIYSPEPIHRLFNYGFTVCNASNTIDINPGYRTETNEDQQGNAFGLSMQPISCVASMYCYLAGEAAGAGIIDDSAAEDDVYVKATELYPIDLIAGTYDQRDTTGYSPFMLLEPRRMGRVPWIRRGRTNFTEWTTSNDVAQSWLHTQGGVFLPWSGSIMP